MGSSLSQGITPTAPTLMDSYFKFSVELNEITQGDYGRITFNPWLKADVMFDKLNLTTHYRLDFGFSGLVFCPKEIRKRVHPGKDLLEIQQAAAMEIARLSLSPLLFTSFFHYHGDPEYREEHWVLFGMLYHRVICQESWGVFDEQTTEAWKYELGGKKVPAMI